MGLAAILSGLYKNNTIISKQKIYAYFRYFTKLFSIVTIALSAIIIIFSSNITNFILGSSEYSNILILLVIAIPFMVNYSIFDSFLRSFEQIDRIVRISIISNAVSLLILIPLIYYYKISGVIIYILVAGIMPFLLFIVQFRNIFRDYLGEFKIKLDRLDKLNVFKIGLSSLLAFFMFQSVIILLRKFIISNFGLEENGLYQSLLGISLNYFIIIYSFFTNHTLPQLSMCETDLDIISILDSTTKFLMFIIVPLTLILFNYRDIILLLLYSQSFVGASDLLIFQLVGDLFRIFAVLFSLWLIPKMRVRQLILIDFIFNCALLVLPYILIIVYQHSLKVVPISYMLAFIIQFLLYFIYTKRNLNFKFSKKTMSILLISGVVLLLSFIFSWFYKYYGYFAIYVFLIIWIYLVFKHVEKILIIDSMKRLFVRH